MTGDQRPSQAEALQKLLRAIARGSDAIEKKHDIIFNAAADLIEEMVEALQAIVADILEYERINNLSPNPGKQDCWQSVTRARAAIRKATGAA